MRDDNNSRLGRLNKLEQEARDIERKERYLVEAAKQLASYRKDERSIPAALDELSQRWRGGSAEAAESRDALLEVLREHQHDLFRLAELRLQERARTKRMSAAYRRAVLDASIIDVPEVSDD